MSVLDVWTEQNRRLAIKLDVLASMVDAFMAVHQSAVSSSTEKEQAVSLWAIVVREREELAALSIRR